MNINLILEDMKGYYNYRGDLIIVENGQIIFTMIAEECTGDLLDDIEEYKRIDSLISELNKDSDMSLLEELF